MDLSELLDLLRYATVPEEVFGDLPDRTTGALKRRYRELATIAHPDHNPRAPDAAAEAFKTLQQWYDAAQRKLSAGVYGAAPLITIASRQHRYVGYEPPLAGDLCDLYPADADGTRVLLKVARSPRNNDLLEAEAKALRIIERGLTGQQVRAHFPTLIEQVLITDTAGARHCTNVLRAEEYVSLAQVLRAYPAGLDLRDAAWMFNRILAALAVAHGLGLVHGALLPSHVLLRLSDHNGMLIDWCYSTAPGEPLLAVSPPYAGDYPPEVAARQPATFATDLYMAAMCLLRMLGGDPAGQQLPPSVPRPVQALLRACLIPAPQRRFHDAWELYDEFQQILNQLYGKRTFRHFHMPNA
ncbi:MAG TPA: DnaJ domain-containing protein [Roseiflexaceae bacterium]|nr:DnaJ domain-containing protein [Roseiflexaceae bacterium]